MEISRLKVFVVGNEIKNHIHNLGGHFFDDRSQTINDDIVTRLKKVDYTRRSVILICSDTIASSLFPDKLSSKHFGAVIVFCTDIRSQAPKILPCLECPSCMFSELREVLWVLRTIVNPSATTMTIGREKLTLKVVDKLVEDESVTQIYNLRRILAGSVSQVSGSHTEPNDWITEKKMDIISVTVRVIKGDDILFKPSEDDSVETLKDMISDVLLCKDIKLMFGSKTLDDRDLLSSCGIRNGSLIYCICNEW